MLKIEAILEIVTKAGKLALAHQQANKLTITTKSDNSPVSDADIAANDIYIEELAKIHPEIPIISEENNAESNHANFQDQYFLIDPIDGTEAFIRQSPDFVSQIAFIENKRPVFAAIYNPARDELYYSDNKKSYLIENGHKETISINNKQPHKIFVSNRLQKKPIFDKIKQLDYEYHHAASSYKFCLLARGDANLIPYFNSIKSWDIAPPDLIVNTAGGIFLDLNGRQLLYDKNDFQCEHFIAASDFNHFEKCINAVDKI
jgi:3'(2'), 5'-bisphosphate nucleotidase